MAKRRPRSVSRLKAAHRRPSPPVARGADSTLRSFTVGALPILNEVLKRMRLEEYLYTYLPAEAARTRPSTPKAILVLVRNLLLSREPLYGVGEWAARHAADLLGLSSEEMTRLNDDRVGRALDRLFLADISSLILAVSVHVVREFQVSLDQLHNDSTSISFFGAYTHAATERHFLGRPTLAITWGYSKDHRPDLKQLLFILTVTEDGAVPVHFRVESGNKTDDCTHRETWDLLCRLAGRPDFLYVADCKLATAENMAYLDARGGRFVSVLPRTRAEDTAFRQRMREGQVVWQHLEDKTDEQGRVLDRYSVSVPTAVTAEGYRLVWYHSTHKAELDAAARAKCLQRALRQLGELRRRVVSPRSRYRQPEHLQKAVTAILEETGAGEGIRVRIVTKEEESYHQERPGRPGPATRYIRSVRQRLELHYEIDAAHVAEASLADGIFPLITNVTQLSDRQLLAAYKRQPAIEKRFSQLKTDFEVAPVYLKGVRRVQAFLGVYFFALMVEALLERELRQAMAREKIEALPMYPEGRPCRRPTTRRLIDLFATVQRHELVPLKEQTQVLLTDLTRLQRKLLRLLHLDPSRYGH